MNSRDRVLAVLVAVVWGVNFLAIDWGLEDVPPLLLLAVRFTLVAVPLVFFVPRPGPWRPILLIGAFMSLGQFSLLYLALSIGMPAGLASLVLQAQVGFTILIAAVVLGERASSRQVAGVLLGTVGLVVVAVGHGLRSPLGPLLVTVLAALSWAIGNVIARQAKIAGGLGLVVWSALIVPVPALGLSLLVDGADVVGETLTHLSAVAIASTLYTVVVSSLFGYVVWNRLLAEYPTASVVPFILLVPPVGILASWVVQGEVPTTIELGGGLLMMIGVAIATLKRGPALVNAR